MAEPPPQQRSALSRAWAWYTRRISALVLAIGRMFGSIGSFTYRRTALVAIVSVVLLIVCAVGWLRLRIVSDGDKLWVPQHNKAKSDEKWLKANYGTSTKAALFTASVKESRPELQDNVISLPTVWEMWQLDGKIRALEVSKGGKKYRYQDICYRSEGACLKDGFFDFWNMSFPAYLASVGGSDTDPLKGSAPALFKDIATLNFPDGKAVSVLSIFGGVKLSPPPSRVIASRAIQVVYPLDRDVSNSVATKWLDKYLDLLKAEAKRTQYATIDYLSSTSIDNEISSSISADLYLIAIAIVVFMIVAVISISKLDGVRTRSSLAVVGLLSALLAMIAGYGIAMAIGVPFTSLQQTLPFILLGVSIDVMIILTSAFDEAVMEDPSLTPAERFRHLMSTAGLSVGVTTLASAMAFALGTITSLPAITYFSAYATLSVTCIFFSQVTFFLAVFIWTERRIAAGRYDCLCCIASRNAPPPHPSTIAIPVRTPPVTTAPTPATIPPPAEATKVVLIPPPSPPAPHTNPLNKFFAEKYAPFLLSWPIRGVVLAAFIAWAVFSAWSVNQLGEGQPLKELAPDSSYLQPFLKLMEATFDRQVGPPVEMVFRGVDPSPPAIQAKMLQALNVTLLNSYINVTVCSFQGNWLLEFIGYAAESKTPLVQAGCFNPYVNQTEILTSIYSDLISPQPLPGCVPQDKFYPLLAKFLEDPRYRSYKDDVVRFPNGTVRSSRFPLLQRSGVGEDRYDRLALKTARSTEDSINERIFGDQNKAAKDDVFLLFSSAHQYGEGLAILKFEALLYIIMAVVGVGGVLLLMLVHPLAALLMMASVAIVDLFLFGEMYVLSIRFNYVSIINMVMATGLAVDYSVYLAHKFMNTEGPSRTARMTHALGHTGPAVFLGALTSLAGSIPLAFSSSTILRTFFSLLFGTVVFAILVGLVLMPVVFATIGPAPISRMAAGGGGGEKEAEVELAGV